MPEVKPLVEEMYKSVTEEDIKIMGLKLFFETKQYRLFKDVLGHIYLRKIGDENGRRKD